MTADFNDNSEKTPELPSQTALYNSFPKKKEIVFQTLLYLFANMSTLMNCNYEHAMHQF